MLGQTPLTYILVGLLLTYTVGAPVEETKEKKQIFAIPIIIGVEELLAGSLLAGAGAAAGAVAGAAASSLLSQTHSGSSNHDSHACSGYSTKYSRTTGGWCRPSCFSHEISVPNGSCGSNICCIPNN